MELLVLCEMSNVKCSQKIKVAVIPMSYQMSIVKIETIPNCQDWSNSPGSWRMYEGDTGTHYTGRGDRAERSNSFKT